MDIEHQIDFHPIMDVILQRYDSDGSTYTNDHQLEGAKIYEVDTIDDEKIILVIGKWMGSSSGRSCETSGPNELEIWKNRTKTAEAKVDNLEELLREKDEALKPFAEKFAGSETTDKFVERISWYDGAKAAEAYYIDKTEGD